MKIKITDDFFLHEIECKCGCGACNTNTVSINQLQLPRDFLDRPIIISSACRCFKHNKSVGGSDYSKHLSTAVLRCTAFDARVSGMSCLELMEILENHDNEEFWTGRGHYPYENFIHIDSGHSKMTRWIRHANRKYETVDKF